MSDTIFLRRGDTLTPLHRTDFGSEADIQLLLSKYPDLLSGQQINPDDPRRWLLVAREMGVPSAEGDMDEFRLDHLFVDQDAVPTLVEVKGSWNTELRREVIGQMLDYASRAVAFWTADRLADRFSTRCSAEGLDPGAELRRHLHSPEGERDNSPEFWRRAETNLRAGEIRLLFVADRVPESLKRVVEFLNGQMRLTEVLAVELPQFVGGVGSDLQTLVPRVFGMTAEARTRKRASGGGGASAPADCWTEVEFLSHIEHTQGAEVARIAVALLEGCKHAGAFVGGGAYALILQWPIVENANPKRNADWVWPFYILDNGKVAVIWQFIKPPFDQDAKRKDLLARLIAIQGVSLAPDAIRGRPAFPLTALAPPANLTRFLEVANWVRDEVVERGA